jgi:transcriptional activator protein UGA3
MDLTRLASQIMAVVARVPHGSPTESGLLYPLFLAGGELSNPTEMEICAEKLNGVRERTQMGNVAGVEEVLREVWRATKEGRRQDWLKVLADRQWFLNIG